jgi:hypothetical protein
LAPAWVNFADGSENESPPDSFLVSGNVVLKYRQNLDLHEGARFDSAFGQLHIDARVRRSFQRFASVKCNNVPFCHKPSHPRNILSFENV